MKLLYNLFCRDVDAQLDFYVSLLGLMEIDERRTPIYRALDAGTEFGFNARPAYALLNLAEHEPLPDAAPVTRSYCTFLLDTPPEIDIAAQRAVALGGSVVKGPYATYYGQWQAVMADPEGHVFRVSCLSLPPGVQAPALR
jgi:catechol 2,3-dioxygenase-like lactoylglutathione lyase family enzyme